MSNTITEALETIEAFADSPEAKSTLHFELPPELEAGEPPEARGLATSQSYSEPVTPSSSTPAAP